MCFNIYPTLNDCKMIVYFGNIMYFFEYSVYLSNHNILSGKRDKQKTTQEGRLTGSQFVFIFKLH